MVADSVWGIQSQNIGGQTEVVWLNGSRWTKNGSREEIRGS